MADLLNLTCPACSGKLQIPALIDRFTCGFCGTELAVHRGGGIVTLSLATQNPQNAPEPINSSVLELTTKRLEKEIASLELQRAEITGRYIWVWLTGGIGVFTLCWWLAAGLLFGFAGQGLYLYLGCVLLIVAVWLSSYLRAAIRARIAPIDKSVAEKTAQLEEYRSRL